MSRAVCTRCGADRAAIELACPGCGHRPSRDGLLVAWLVSDANLSSDDLDAAAARIKAGQPLHPTRAQLERARRALGAHLTSDPGLPVSQRVALLVVGLAITPLPGLILWYWWRASRPRASLQALALSLPAGVFYIVLVLVLRLA